MRSGGIDFRSQVWPRQAGGRARGPAAGRTSTFGAGANFRHCAEVVMTAGRSSTQGLAGFPPRASVWMRISSTYAYVQGFPCLLQFGEGKKTHKDTEKLQLEVCSGPEAARCRQNRQHWLPPQRCQVTQARFLILSLGTAAAPASRGGRGIRELIGDKRGLA